MKPKKSDLLSKIVEHIDIKDPTSCRSWKHDQDGILARDLAGPRKFTTRCCAKRIARSFFACRLTLFRRLEKCDCLSSGTTCDAIVSTGAIIVTRNFFEALGFKHYKGEINMDTMSCVVSPSTDLRHL